VTRQTVLVQRELAGIGVEVEGLSVPPPVDGGLQLMASLLLGESPAEEVQEEPLTQIAVRGGGPVEEPVDTRSSILAANLTRETDSHCCSIRCLLRPS